MINNMILESANIKKRNIVVELLLIFLLVITTLGGILSINFSGYFTTVNQFGETIRLYGHGIYKWDSFLKGAINIGTDINTLLFVIPLLLYFTYSYYKKPNNYNLIGLISIHGAILYGSFCSAFGIKHNSFFLLYVFTLTLSLFRMLTLVRDLKGVKAFEAGRGVKIFLVFSALAMLLAWLPDILPTIFSGNPIIEIYTTEVTYVLDMGIISPMCFMCIYLLDKKEPLGTVILSVLLRICIIVAVLMIPQSLIIYLAGIIIPFPELLTKTISFILLGGFAYYFLRKVSNHLKTT